MPPLLYSSIYKLAFLAVLWTPVSQAAPGLALAPGPAPLYAAKAEDHYDIPRYHYSYGVQDLETGDIKSQSESRDGDIVTGQYSLVEPDGSIRTVEYTADSHSGFNAVVSKSGPGIHAKPATVPVAISKPIIKPTLAIPTVSHHFPVSHIPVAPTIANIPVIPTNHLTTVSKPNLLSFPKFPAYQHNQFAFATPTIRPQVSTTPSLQQQLVALYPQPTQNPLPVQEGEQAPRPFRYPQGSSGSRPSSTGPIQFPETPEETEANNQQQQPQAPQNNYHNNNYANNNNYGNNNFANNNFANENFGSNFENNFPYRRQQSGPY